MRQVTRSVAVLCLAMCGAGAVPMAAAGAQDPVAKEITRLEDAWAVAQVKHDGAAVARLLADDCMFANPDGTVWSKAQIVADIGGSKSQYVSVVNSDNKVSVHGNTAVVIGRWTATVKAAKGNEVMKYRFTDTWMKQADGKWLYVAGQGNLLEAQVVPASRSSGGPAAR